MRKKLISVDFDGVLNSYVSGWQGADQCPDDPVPGAMAFLADLVDDARFDAVIYSSRCASDEGVAAIRAWLDRHLVAELGEHAGRYVGNRIRVALSKPPAFVAIDDRAITFDGKWPGLDEIDGFVPWNKKPAEAKTDGAAAIYRRLPIKVEAFQFVPDMPTSAVPDWFRESVAKREAEFHDHAEDSESERKVFSVELEQVDSQYPIQVPASAWVVRGATGEIYALSDGEFQAGHKLIATDMTLTTDLDGRPIVDGEPAISVEEMPAPSSYVYHVTTGGGCDRYPDWETARKSAQDEIDYLRGDDPEALGGIGEIAIYHAAPDCDEQDLECDGRLVASAQEDPIDEGDRRHPGYLPREGGLGGRRSADRARQPGDRSGCSRGGCMSGYRIRDVLTRTENEFFANYKGCTV